MTNTRARQNRNVLTRRVSPRQSTNSRNRRSVNSDNPRFYSLGVVENNGVYKVVDTLMLQRVNQFKTAWKRVDSRNVSRALNRGTLVIK